MTPFILYQIKAGICISLFTGLYYLVFRKETFYLANRIYLVSSLILSACIPFIKLPIFSMAGNKPFLTVINPAVIRAIATKTTPESENASFLSVIYLSVVSIFLLYILVQFIRLFILISQYKSVEINGCRVYHIEKKEQSFSFFRIIFISSSAENESPVLQHEMAHANQYHTLDILLLQTFKMFQWFNPFIYLAEKAIQETHEYLADEAALEHDSQSDRYRMLLVAQAFGAQPGIFNFFNYSLIKNRLIMITKERSLRRQSLKYLSTLPLLVFALLLLGIPGISQTAEKQSPVAQEKAKITSAQNQTNVQDPTYVQVDQQAEFQGGALELFRDWIQKQLIYPKEAVSNKIQGKIIVQFSVNPEGKVRNVAVLRGVHPLLDNEAVRVIQLSPDWTPAKLSGKNVEQQFAIPVIFSLGEKVP
jgi:TonB family protein